MLKVAVGSMVFGGLSFVAAVVANHRRPQRPLDPAHFSRRALCEPDYCGAARIGHSAKRISRTIAPVPPELSSRCTATRDPNKA